MVLCVAKEAIRMDNKLIGLYNITTGVRITAKELSRTPVSFLKDAAI